MLTVQVSYKNSTDAHWDTLARYATRLGVNNFLARNKFNYPEEIFTIRVIGEEEAKPKAPNYRELVKIGDVFVSSWSYDATFYEAYVVVSFTPSGKSLKVKKLDKTNASDEISGYGPCAWGIKFVKPFDEFMQNSENVKNVRLLEHDGVVIFYTDSHKIEDSYIESGKIVKSHIIVNEITELDKKFNYDNVYIEGLFE